MNEISSESHINSYQSIDEKCEARFDENEEITSKLATLEDENLEEIKAVGPDGKIEIFRPDVLSKTTWKELGIPTDLIARLVNCGFNIPSKCQHLCLTAYQKFSESCLLLQSPNGSGKTLAFLVATLLRIDPNISHKPEVHEYYSGKIKKQKIVYYPQAIILAHTRELTVQIARILTMIINPDNTLDCYKGIKMLLIKAGNYSKVLEGGHILITTPGVFKNLKNLKKGSLTNVSENYKDDTLISVSAERAKIITVDECDEIFQNEDNKNFLEDTVFKKVDSKAFIIFSSATINNSIKNFIDTVIKEGQNKETVIYEISPDKLTLKGITQLSMSINQNDIDRFIVKLVSQVSNSTGFVIFTNTIFEANKIMTSCREENIDSMIVHGKLSIKKRDLAIDDLQKKKILVLISTNLLSRGFDNSMISLVINIGLPMKDDPNKMNHKILDYETYLHRIGRTGRFTSQGVALTLITNKEEANMIKDIENHFGCKINTLQLNEDFPIVIDDMLSKIKV